MVLPRAEEGGLSGSPAAIREAADVPVRAFPYPFARQARWTPNPASAAASTCGFGHPVFTTTGTLTARNPATTNVRTRTWRQGLVSTAAVGQVITARTGILGTVSVGDGGTPPLGGFGMRCKFMISDAAAVAGARMLLGAANFVGAYTNGNPAAVLNHFGVGHGDGQTNLHIHYGGSVAQTPIDLGAGFPITHGSANLYEFWLFAPPDEANTIHYRVTNVESGAVAEGTVTGGSTILPQSTLILTPFNAYRTNNATGVAVGLDLGEVIIEANA